MDNQTLITELAKIRALFQARTVATVINGGPLPNELTTDSLVRFHWPDVRTKDLERSCGPDLINGNTNDCHNTQGKHMQCTRSDQDGRRS